jgi:exodeoxyribonuclease-5
MLIGIGNYSISTATKAFKHMILTTEQERAAEAIRRFLTDDNQTLVLHGLAGTGKTTVLTALANEFTDVKLCAFTGKAASVLRAKSGLEACTVHSLFYKLVDKGTDEKTGKRILHFRRVHAENAMRGKIILLDECSMIDARTATDLIQSGAKIIAVGDPGQLPPVHGATFFSHPDITLTQIHRQALESPIIRQAHRRSANPGMMTCCGADNLPLARAIAARQRGQR